MVGYSEKGVPMMRHNHLIMIIRIKVFLHSHCLHTYNAVSAGSNAQPLAAGHCEYQTLSVETMACIARQLPESAHNRFQLLLLAHWHWDELDLLGKT